MHKSYSCHTHGKTYKQEHKRKSRTIINLMSTPQTQIQKDNEKWNWKTKLIKENTESA